MMIENINTALVTGRAGVGIARSKDEKELLFVQGAKNPLTRYVVGEALHVPKGFEVTVVGKIPAKPMPSSKADLPAWVVDELFQCLLGMAAGFRIRGTQYTRDRYAEEEDEERGSIRVPPPPTRRRRASDTPAPAPRVRSDWLFNTTSDILRNSWITTPVVEDDPNA